MRIGMHVAWPSCPRTIHAGQGQAAGSRLLVERLERKGTDADGKIEALTQLVESKMAALTTLVEGVADDLQTVKLSSDLANCTSHNAEYSFFFFKSTKLKVINRRSR